MLLLLYPKNESRPSPSTKLTCKDSAKNRFSEGKENIFSFLSVRFLSKSKTIQNKSPKKIFFDELLLYNSRIMTIFVA